MSEVLKTIGSYTLTEADVDQFIMSLPPEQRQYAVVPEFRQRCLDRMEEICLFALLGESEKLEETEQYKQIMANARRDVLSQMAMGNVLSALTVDEEELKAYFEAHKTEFAAPPSASAKHILVDELEKCQEIKASIESGAITFEDAAKEHSTCPSKERGGDLGKFGRGQMVPEFDHVVFTEELNKVHGPVKTQFGFHLILITERTDGAAPAYEAVAEKVRTACMTAKQESAYTAKVAELKARFE